MNEGRALAVHMSRRGHSYRDRAVLQVSIGFVTACTQRYEAAGVDGLRLNYWGTGGYLNAQQKQELFDWLAQKDTWTLEEVILQIESRYRVVYKSKALLLCAAPASRIQLEEVAIGASRPGADASSPKKAEIIELLVKWPAEIASGEVRVMFKDECHLLWRDICGYGWSRRNQRVDVEVKSTKERQTYRACPGLFDQELCGA